MASPPAKKRSRHSLSVAAVTRCLREVDSRSAPRSNSRTTDVLRFADHRPAPGSGPDSGDCSVALRAPSAAPESALFVLDMLSLLQNILSTKCSQPAVQRNSGPGEILYQEIEHWGLTRPNQRSGRMDTTRYFCRYGSALSTSGPRKLDASR